MISMQPLCLFYTCVNSFSATWNCHPIVNKTVVGLWWEKSVGEVGVFLEEEDDRVLRERGRRTSRVGDD